MWIDDLIHREAFSEEEMLSGFTSDELPEDKHYIYEIISQSGPIDIILEREIALSGETKSVYKLSNEAERVLEENARKDILLNLPKSDSRFSEYFSIEKHVAHMSYAEGNSILDILRSQKWSIQERVNAIEALCQTLTDLHHAGYCHGDFTFGNVKLQRIQDNKFKANLLDYESAIEIVPKHLSRAPSNLEAIMRDNKNLFYLISHLIKWSSLSTIFSDKRIVSLNNFFLKSFAPVRSPHEITAICEFSEAMMKQLD